MYRLLGEAEALGFKPSAGPVYHGEHGGFTEASLARGED